MNKSKNKLIPELRFPEFENESEWETLKVGEVFEVTRGNVLSMSLVKEIQSEGNPYPVFSSQTKNSGLAGYYNTFLYEDAITWTTDGANAGDVNFRSGKFYCTNVCGVLINKEGYANSCISELINSVSKKHVSYVGNPKLMNGVMSKIRIPVPSINEQQKISSCLTSIDGIVDAHNLKLNALEEHKKGLLQNLFPQEGETVPKYRFSEFKNDGDWMEKKLGDKDVSFFVNQKITIKQLKLNTYISTENMLPEFSGIRVINKLPSNGSFTKFIKGDILISNIRPYLKKVWKADIDGAASNDVLVFRAGKEVLSEFLEYIIKNDSFINYVMKSAKGVKMPRGDKNAMQEYSIFVPLKKEQQKIATCLSSLDDLITAQIKKIKQLKLHKKGLMQVLFPKI